MTYDLFNFSKYVSHQQLSSIPTLFPPDLDDHFGALALSNVINVLTFNKKNVEKPVGSQPVFFANTP